MKYLLEEYWTRMSFRYYPPNYICYPLTIVALHALAAQRLLLLLLLSLDNAEKFNSGNNLSLVVSSHSPVVMITHSGPWESSIVLIMVSPHVELVKAVCHINYTFCFISILLRCDELKNCQQKLICVERNEQHWAYDSDQQLWSGKLVSSELTLF